MPEHFPPPQHLHFHQEGAFLDVVLDDVKCALKAQALQQPHPISAGYMEGLQPPQPKI